MNATVVSVVDTGPSLAIHDTTGLLLRRIQIPWPEYHASHPLQRQILLARDDAGTRCVGALVLGSGLAGFDGSRVLWTAAYREDVRPPQVRVRTSRGANGTVTVESQLVDRTTAANLLAVGATTAYVAFGGRTPLAGKIVDMFSLDAGAYTGTLRLTRAVRGLAASGQRLYVVVYEDGYPAILGYDIPGG